MFKNQQVCVIARRKFGLIFVDVKALIAICGCDMLYIVINHPSGSVVSHDA